jgi:hypothetical protein
MGLIPYLAEFDFFPHVFLQYESLQVLSGWVPMHIIIVYEKIEVIGRQEKVHEIMTRSEEVIHHSILQDQISSMKIRPFPRADPLCKFTETRCVDTHPEEQRGDCIIKKDKTEIQDHKENSEPSSTKAHNRRRSVLPRGGWKGSGDRRACRRWVSDFRANLSECFILASEVE